jgi:diadenosine tetraphosphatase ApaH/serine/threonine PP2A family protein phosphatase
MRLGIFADIHGNLEALTAVLDDMAGRGVHRFICLGDLVGYGASPNECIDLVRRLPRLNCILGNHDAASVWRFSPYNLSKYAKESMLWTMEQLTPENASFLKKLPPTLTMLDLVFSHANPYNPEGWRYVTDRKYAMRCFSGSRGNIFFISHTHSPMIISKKGFWRIDLKKVRGNSVIEVPGSKRRIINCGSVGQPRDRDMRAGYLVYDTRKQQLEFYRVDYDIKHAALKIKEAGLPPFLGQRLRIGQ